LQQLYRQETELESKLMKGNMLMNEAILSVKNLASLALLQHSVVGMFYLPERQMSYAGSQSWFISELNALRSRSGEYLDVQPPVNAEATTAVSPGMPASVPQQPILDHLSLPLSREMGL
jgi:hypothetical protein